MDNSVGRNEEAQLSSTSIRKPGGWITFPFILATMAGLSLAAGGWIFNLTIYLIEEFNIERIDATQISNMLNGCTSLLPVLGAVIADSFLGCYCVIWISSLISLFGIVLLAITATFDSLKPRPCDTGSILCESPTKLQLSVLYVGLAMAAMGVGGTKFTLGTMGANQYDNSKNQDIFFNWFFFSHYASIIVSVTAIIYVQDSVSWGLGFGLTALANLLGLAIFLLGSRFYRHVEANGSPFTGLTRVIVAATRKRRVTLSVEAQDYYQEEEQDGGGGVEKKMVPPKIPTNTFKFLNHAAVKTEGDVKSDGSVAKPWKLCTVQQVEDLKGLIKILPLCSTGIFLATPIAIQNSLTILQALTMDRHLGHYFQIPPGTMIVFTFIFTSASLAIIDRLIYPTWQKLIGQPPSPLQRIAVGHMLGVLSMAVSAVVESRRLEAAKSHNLQEQNASVVPISVLWLVPQLAIVGVAEAFHFPGQVAFYFQEFPTSLKSTATAMATLIIGISFYLSVAIIHTARRVTNWLPDNINHGRVDNMYWVVVVIGGLNLSYFLVCANFYKYQYKEEVEDRSSLDM